MPQSVQVDASRLAKRGRDLKHWHEVRKHDADYHEARLLYFKVRRQLRHESIRNGGAAGSPPS